MILEKLTGPNSGMLLKEMAPATANAWKPAHARGTKVPGFVKLPQLTPVRKRKKQLDQFDALRDCKI